MYNKYFAIVFDCIEDADHVWKVVFPGISDPAPYHAIEQVNETNSLDDKLSRILYDLLKEYEIPPIPINADTIHTDEIARSRNIENIIGSSIIEIEYEGLKDDTRTSAN